MSTATKPFADVGRHVAEVASVFAKPSQAKPSESGVIARLSAMTVLFRLFRPDG